MVLLILWKYLEITIFRILRAAQLATQAVGLTSNDVLSVRFNHLPGRVNASDVDKRQMDLTAYLDFAHAPSKVRATVNAVREKHQMRT